MGAQDIQRYLDKAAYDAGYLDAINGTSPESLVDAQMKIEPLHRSLGRSTLNSIASIGVGQGEELHALRSVFGDDVDILGIDLSEAALSRALARSDTFGLDAQLIRGDATKLPLRDGSLSGLVLSAILHEIYSYNEPDGVEAYVASVQESARVLTPGGILYVREFVAPAQESSLVSLRPATHEAASFYEYFTEHFSVGLEDDRADRRGLDISEDGFLKNTADITQVLLHFRNFWNDKAKGLTSVNDKDWKELKESYILPSPLSGTYMDPTALSDDIMRISRENNTPLDIVDSSLNRRKKVEMFLSQHFRIINDEGVDVSDRLLPTVTSKFEATFLRTEGT